MFNRSDNLDSTSILVPSVRPSGFWGAGTMGSIACIYFNALQARHRNLSGAATAVPVTVFSTDTDHGAAGIRRRLSAASPLVGLEPEQLFLLPSHSLDGLRAALARDPRTRVYADRMATVSGSTTLKGAGGAPIVGQMTAVTAWDELDVLVGQTLERQRNSQVVAESSRQGHAVQLRSPTYQAVACFGGGGSGCGIAPFVAMLIRRHARRLGLSNCQIVLFVASPLSSDGADAAVAAANFTGFMRQIMLAWQRPEFAAIHGFGARELRSDGPLFDRVTIFGPSNGLVTNASRDALAFSMAFAGHQIAYGGGADEVEGFFRDAERFVESDQGALGPRIFGRVGHSVIDFDAAMLRQMLGASGRSRLARRLLDGAHGQAPSGNAVV